MKNKKVIAILLAVIAFIAVMFLLQPPPSQYVVVAASDLPAGHRLTLADLTLADVPAELLGGETLSDPAQAVDQRLAVDRTAGDVIQPRHLGERLTLAPDERAIAVWVDDAAGLVGTLEVGQEVGVVAVIMMRDPEAGQAAFAKAVIEGLKVGYQDPLFSALDPLEAQAVDEVTGLPVAPDRAREAGVVLVVSTHQQAVLYDFTASGGVSEIRAVNALELLAALDASEAAQLYLYLVGEDPAPFASSGIWLPDLLITPAPTPTSTALPDGYLPPSPTPTSTVPPTPTATPAEGG